MKAKDLRRSTASRPERRTILVFCEGKASEPDYINGLKKLPGIQRNTAIKIEIDTEQGTPMTLVERAAARRQRDVEVDEYWCVFDVEWPQHHPNLERACQLADAQGIQVAVSNPCFELWLILHHGDHSAFLDTRSAESRSRRLDGRQGKRIDPDFYVPRRREAARRAASLEARHRRDGTLFPNNNPSSTMYELLAAIEQ